MLPPARALDEGGLLARELGLDRPPPITELVDVRLDAVGRVFGGAGVQRHLAGQRLHLADHVTERRQQRLALRALLQLRERARVLALAGRRCVARRRSLSAPLLSASVEAWRKRMLVAAPKKMWIKHELFLCS